MQTVYVTDDGSRVVQPGWDVDIAFGATVTGLVIPDATQPSGYKAVAVTVGADSTFSVPGVPFGDYFIQVDLVSSRILGSDTVLVSDRMLYEASTNTPDLSMVLAKRAGASPINALGSDDTMTTLSFSGLAPISSQDTFKFFATQYFLNANFPERELSPAPDAGSTQFSAGIFWDERAFGVRPVAAKGDAEYVIQRRQTTDAGVTDQETLSFAKVSDFTYVDGGPNSMTAVFAAPSQTGALPSELQFSAFDAMSDAIHPDAGGSTADFTQPTIAVVGIPHSATFPNQPITLMPGPPIIVDFGLDSEFLIDQAPQAFQFKSLAFPSPTADVTLSPAAASFPHFLDANWQESAEVLYFWDVPLAGSATNTFTMTGGGFYRSFAPPAQLPSPVAPQLGPPSAPLLNGTNAFNFQTGVGTQPTISWSPPALGTASKYFVTVVPATSFKDNDIASLTVVLYDKTSLKLPDGFLKAGTPYCGIITAMSSPDRLNSPILGLGSPRVEVNTIFGLFQP
ncbi:MAG TPA: hypothetical protein VH083_06925 [Myxococcales bacterium]|nr:hypothetical protein [Myxococcales bacterium]